MVKDSQRLCDLASGGNDLASRPAAGGPEGTGDVALPRSLRFDCRLTLFKYSPQPLFMRFHFM
jgi:hypothetical protein